MQPTEDTPPSKPTLPIPDIGDSSQPIQIANGQDELLLKASFAPQLPEVSPASPAAPGSAPPLAQATPVSPVAPIVTPPTTADDDDLIEQEWVDKAKAIVDRTKDDPYMQNEELSKFKADYIKKRYNREIKVTEN